MPLQLLTFLKSEGIDVDSASPRGWNRLSNGALVAAAADAGFTALLIRDRLFGESAAQALKSYTGFGVVIITLPQIRAPLLINPFKAAWNNQQIVPVAGFAVEWP